VLLFAQEVNPYLNLNASSALGDIVLLSLVVKRSEVVAREAVAAFPVQEAELPVTLIPH